MSQQVLKNFESQLKDKILTKNNQNLHEAKFLQKQFKYFDIQNRGKVNFDQFYRAMEKTGVILPRADMLTIFYKYDVNGDSEIDYKEFSNIFFGESSQYQAPDDPYLKEKARREQMTAQLKGDNPENLLRLFKDKMKRRGPKGIIGLQRLFKMMDDDGSQTLSLPEFVKLCRDLKVGVTDENAPILFAKFDVNNDGTLNYTEFINAIRPKLSNEKKQMVEKVFASLDKNQNGFLDLDEVKARFNVNRHPDVVQGKRSQHAVLTEFFETIEAHHGVFNGQIADG